VNTGILVVVAICSAVLAAWAGTKYVERRNHGSGAGRKALRGAIFLSVAGLATTASGIVINLASNSVTPARDSAIVDTSSTTSTTPAASSPTPTSTTGASDNPTGQDTILPTTTTTTPTPIKAPSTTVTVRSRPFTATLAHSRFGLDFDTPGGPEKIDLEYADLAFGDNASSGGFYFIEYSAGQLSTLPDPIRRPSLADCQSTVSTPSYLSVRTGDQPWFCLTTNEGRVVAVHVDSMSRAEDPSRANISGSIWE
jgi:hypothetical protein